MIDVDKYKGHEITCSHEWYTLRADAKLLLAEVVRLRRDLHDTIRESQQYRAERDEALDALKDITPAMPSPLAHCHYGLLLQEECAHCNRIAAARAVLAKHGDGK